jgi:DedD protein
MERQTKHRILGIFVIIGLVVILLPLFQDNKEAPIKTTFVKAPPFPDQARSVASTSLAQGQAPVTPGVGPSASDGFSVVRPMADQPQNAASVAVSAQETLQPSQTAIDHQGPIHPAAALNVKSSFPQSPLAKNEIVKSAAATSKSAANVSSGQISKTAKHLQIQTGQYKIIEGEKAVALLNKARQHKHAHKTKYADNRNKVKAAAPKQAAKAATAKTALHTAIAKHALKTNPHQSITKKAVQTTAAAKHPAPHNKPALPVVTASLDDDGLIKLKSAVWVIQIGNFKNKTNALKMVNELRSNGYRAFIQQFSSAFGEHTSVFVGPENNPSAARTLADRLKNEMHIQGMVISYKPLTL